MADKKYKIIDGQRYEVLSTTSTPVTAKHCLWFAWADNNNDGPHGEDRSGDTYNPPSFDLVGMGSPDFVEIAVTSPTSQKWSHDNGNHETDASGRSGVKRELECVAYRSSVYNSQQISFQASGGYPLNALVALVGTDKATTSEIWYVGLGREIPVAGKTTLFLGFHDGYEWSNNTGEITVSVTPAVAAPDGEGED